MATLKHLGSKNADYGAAEQYLLFEHDEFTMKPVLDENGRLIPREDYRLSTLNCGGEDFAVACMRSNLRYEKNQRREDVKSHHYIISFDPRDGPDNGLTVDRAQALGEQFCKEHFPGHQALVCTHPDGHNHSGNIHVHIVINSLRIEEVPFLPYMDRPADTKAGCKHRCTDAALRYFKSEVMEMCHREGLYQIDLLNGSKNRVTDREYWAQKKGQAALDKQNAPMIAGGITPRQTKFETNKEKLRQTLRKALATAASFDEFSSLLLREGVTVKESRGRLSYLTPDRTKPITARKLGGDFDRTAVLAVLEQNAQRGVTVRYTPQHQAARAAEQTAAIPEYLHAGKGRLQGEKTGKIDPRQDSVQRLVDIEQKMAEGKGKGYLTSDMAESLPVLVNLVASAMPFRKGIAISCDAAQVINDKKVTDHHAVIPTRNLQGADLSGLPVGEKAVLELVALRLLCAVAEPHTYAETAVTVECAGAEFTAKGRTVKNYGWRALDAAYRAGLKNAEPDKETEDKALPELKEGQSLPLSGAAVKEGKTTPPKHFTEDTLLSAMETAGKDDMPEDAERKGLGTPATRAGILEKLVSTGFLERKKSKKTVQLMPSHDAVSLITVLPEQLQSPLLTAEWEYRLGEIERGELTPEDFMDGISTMLKELVGTYQMIKGTEYLFTPPREVVGKCPRCGGDVVELQKGFFCQNEGCKFAIWKNNKWWAAKKKQPTKAVVAALLKDGRTRITGCYSEKTGKTYDATVVLEDDGQYTNFRLEFDQQKGGKR